MKIKIHEVRDAEGVIHFSAISQEEAERFVDRYDADFGVVLEMYELTREAVDHTKNQ